MVFPRLTTVRATKIDDRRVDERMTFGEIPATLRKHGVGVIVDLSTEFQPTQRSLKIHRFPSLAQFIDYSGYYQALTTFHYASPFTIGHEFGLIEILHCLPKLQNVRLFNVDVSFFNGACVLEARYQLFEMEIVSSEFCRYYRNKPEVLQRIIRQSKVQVLCITKLTATERTESANR